MDIPNVLKYTFLLHFIVAIIFGVLFFFSPEFYVDMSGWPFLDPAAGRVMGAGFLGFAITSLFGYMATTWEEVRIVVLGEIVFTLLGMIASLWMILVHATIPALWGWFNVLIMALFFVLFLYSYYIATR